MSADELTGKKAYDAAKKANEKEDVGSQGAGPSDDAQGDPGEDEEAPDEAEGEDA
jgi:hypothetical protein